MIYTEYHSGKAVIKDIHSYEYDVDEKLNAIQGLTMGEVSIKKVAKEDLLEALRYLIEEYI